MIAHTPLCPPAGFWRSWRDTLGLARVARELEGFGKEIGKANLEENEKQGKSVEKRDKRSVEILFS